MNYDQPIGTPITDMSVNTARQRAAARDIDPDERALRAENILPQDLLPDPASDLRHKPITQAEVDKIRADLRARGISEDLFDFEVAGPEVRPVHIAPDHVKYELLAALEARYGTPISSIAIAFKDGTSDYIVSSPESPT